MNNLTKVKLDAINTFFKTGKSDGWYSSLKRLYLPIWTDVAANSIDMVTRTSGTFTPTGVDHSNVGYVQGDGSTGYFDYGANLADMGLTSSQGGYGVLFAPGTPGLAAESSAWRVVHGVRGPDLGGGFSSYTSLLRENLNVRAFTRYCDSTNTVFTTPSASIISCFVIGGAGRVRQRNASGFVVDTTITPWFNRPLGNFYALGGNNNGTPAPSVQRVGAHYIQSGHSVVDDANFTLALKTLWETCTGLTLP